MSHLHSARAGATLVSAAMLSLAVLAGCQSGTATKPPGSDTGDIASTNNAPAAIGGSGLSTLSEQLISVGDRVHFAVDRHDLASEAETTLQQQAALLRQHPGVAVTIQGHADERGTREYNLALGERRATSVENYLIALGIPADRISVISFGKERPECIDAAEPCWAQNRRGVTTVNQ